MRIVDYLRQPVEVSLEAYRRRGEGCGTSIACYLPEERCISWSCEAYSQQKDPDRALPRPPGADQSRRSDNRESSTRTTLRLSQNEDSVTGSYRLEARDHFERGEDLGKL